MLKEKIPTGGHFYISQFFFFALLRILFGRFERILIKIWHPFRFRELNNVKIAYHPSRQVYLLHRNYLFYFIFFPIYHRLKLRTTGLSLFLV